MFFDQCIQTDPISTLPISDTDNTLTTQESSSQNNEIDVHELRINSNETISCELLNTTLCKRKVNGLEDEGGDVEKVFTLNDTPKQNFKIKYSKKTTIPLTESRMGYTLEVGSTKNDEKLSLLVDTGASVSILPLHYLNSFQHTLVKNENVKLRAYNKAEIQVNGVYKVHLNIPKFGRITQKFIIVDENSTPIMGLDFLSKIRGSLIWDQRIGQHVLEIPRSYLPKKTKLTIIESKPVPPGFTGYTKIMFTSTIPLRNEKEIIIQPKGPVMPSICSIHIVEENIYEISVAVNNGGDNTLSITELDGEINFSYGDKSISKYEDYEVDMETFQTLSPFIPNLSNSQTINTIDNDSKSTITEYVHCIRASPKNDPLLAFKNEIAYDMLYSKTCNDIDNVLNVTNCPAPQPPPESVRKGWVEEKISNLNCEEDVKHVLYNNIEAISSSDMDAGESKESMFFNVRENFYKNKMVYKLDKERLEFLKSQLTILEYNGFIEKIHVNYGIPVFTIRSGSNNKQRLVFDMRRSNLDIIDESRTFLPDTFDIIQNVAQDTRFFSSVDLKRCFWGIKLSQEVLNTGFPVILTQLGSFLVKRCLTGMCNAPSWLENYLSKILLTNSQGEYSPLQSLVVPFYDDISISSPDIFNRQDHLHDLDLTLKRIARSGLRISLEKSVFAKDLFSDSVSLLGYTISHKSITPNADKIEALRKIDLPTTLVRLQKLLGSCVYYRKCLNLKAGGAIAKLHEFTGKNKFDCKNEEYIKAFELLKENLENLTIFKPEKGSLNLLWTDSSSIAIGAVLMNIACTAMPRRKYKLSRFEGYITKNLSDRISSASDWTKKLEVATSDSNLFKSIYKLVSQMNYESSYDAFIENILVKVYLNSKLYAPALPFSEKETKNLFNEIYHQTETKKECIQKKYDLYVRYMMICELTKILNRQFIFLTEKSYYFVGFKQEKSPIILFESSDLYYTLVHPTPFLEFPGTLSKTIDDLKLSEIPDLIQKISEPNCPFEVKPLGFMTKKLSKAESKRPIYVNETYAIYSSLSYFYEETKLTKTVVLCDNLPSVQLLENKKFNQHLFPLLLKLNTEFSHVPYVYIRGKYNASDIFSRPSNAPPFNHKTGVKSSMFDSKDFELYHNYDSLIERANDSAATVHTLETCFDARKDFFKHQLSDENFKKYSESHPPKDLSYFDLELGVYYHKTSKKKFLPSPLEYTKIAEIHYLMGHSGVKRITDLILHHFMVASRKKLVEKIDTYNKNCLACLMCKPDKLSFVKGEIFAYNQMQNFSYVSADIFEFQMGDEKSFRTAKSNKALLFYDHYSQFISVYLLKDGTEDSVIRSFISYFSNNKIPKRVLIDNASNLRSFQLQKIFRLLGVSIVRSSPYNSKSRGNIESKIKSIREVLRILKMEIPNISSQLLLTLAVPFVNSRPHLNHIASPYEIKQNCLYQFMPFLENHRIGDDNCRETRKKFNLIIKKLKNDELKRKGNILSRQNASRQKANYYEENDFVILKSYTNSNKQQPLYLQDIFVVSQVNSNSLFLKRLVDNFETVRAFSQVKKLHRPKFSCELPDNLVELVGLVDWSKNIPILEPKLVFENDVDKQGVRTRQQIRDEKLKLLSE